MKLSQKLITLLFFIYAGMLLSCAPIASNLAYSNRNTTADSENSGIIGGTVVPSTSELSKSIVLLYDNKGFICTGSIIAANVVLTAAHCVEDVSEMNVIFDVKIRSGAERRLADKFIIHSSWATNQNNQFDNGDIALLHYKGTTPKGYKPATLLKDKTKLINGAKVLLAGYGITDDDADDSGILRQVNVTIAKSNFGKTEIAMEQRDGRGACQGDSGGPAYINVAGKNLLFGVTSRGAEKCAIFGIYTSTLPYQSWIDKGVQTLSKTGNPFSLATEP